jgi:hypothetical protein
MHPIDVKLDPVFSIGYAIAAVLERAEDHFRRSYRRASSH